MADFETPFGSGSEKRYPSPDEKDLGFPCGPADQSLFNGLFFRIESELGKVIDEAGIPQSDAQHDRLFLAIEALISAATGGNPAGYVLMSQARARLPIFPEILNSDGKIIVVSPGSGQVRLPGGVDFLHRGIFTLTTAQTDFATDPSKTYHLRWSVANGYQLRDLVNGGAYNPTGLAESNPTFDSKYDDMLIARVVTNSSNVVTITPLVNKHDLMLTQAVDATNLLEVNTANARGDIIAPLNWARTPKLKGWSWLQRSQLGTATQNDYDEFIYPLGQYPAGVLGDGLPATRYQIAYTMVVDFAAYFTHSVMAGA